MKCRACFGIKLQEFVDLGYQPPSNDFTFGGLKQYPLKVVVCEDCGLGQMEHDVDEKEIFNDHYAYFSSASPTWVADRKALADRMTNELRLESGSLVIDIGGNDGYYLEHFLGTCGVLNYEPSANVAEAAEQKGIKTRCEFWGQDTARKIGADLINATNVLAHTPDMDGFIAGVAGALAPQGVATLEFPLFTNLIKFNQLDTIYHEHYSYISIRALQPVLERHGLRIWRIEELATHGGSVRVFAAHKASRFREEESVERVRASELFAPDIDFEAKARKVKWDLLEYLSETGPVAGYGAPAKATVLANYCGLANDIIQFTVDDSPAKQGHDIPGTNIPIISFDELGDWDKPPAFLIFPWNLKAPIAEKLRRFYSSYDLPPSARPHIVTAIPKLEYTTL
jgi:hypothetical protein